MTTHSALSRRSFGMPSGMPRISFMTVYDSWIRSFSFFWEKAGMLQARVSSATIVLFMMPPGEVSASFKRLGPDGTCGETLRQNFREDGLKIDVRRADRSSRRPGA